jgi:fibronectin type 3 domain-containing protein
MHTLLRCLLIASAIGALFAMPQSVAAQDTGQVTKPLSEPTLSTERLPAPKPSARQGTDGKITVTWAPVEGAISYRMWRSVPPTPQAIVTLANPQATSYVDADIKAGSTYYYLVAAVNSAGIEGLRGPTTPVTATKTAATFETTTPTVKGTVTQQDTLRISLEFFAPDAVSYEIRRTIYLSFYDDPSRIDYSKPAGPVLMSPVTTNAWTDTSLRPEPLLRQVTYTVTARSASGVTSPPGKVDLVIPAATTSTTTSTTDPATSTGATTSGTAPTVTAKLEQQDPLQVLVSYGVANGRNYEVERTMYRSRSADPSQIDYSSPMNTTRWTLANTTLTDSYLMYPDAFARSVSYTVRANMWDGTVTPIGKSNVLILPASGSTTTSSTAITGSTTFTVATAATVKNGATTSLAASIGSPARWVSLNESVATVDASGTVTGRLTGSTRIVALASSSDGSLRVVAIPLTVTP